MKQAAAAFLLIVFSCVSSLSAQNVVIRGSDTMILLGQKCSQMFNRKSQEIKFTVQGGGVKAGLEALNAGKAEVVQTENAVSDAENMIKLPAGVQAIVVYAVPEPESSRRGIWNRERHSAPTESRRFFPSGIGR